MIESGEHGETSESGETSVAGETVHVHFETGNCITSMFSQRVSCGKPEISFSVAEFDEGVNKRSGPKSGQPDESTGFVFRAREPGGGFISTAGSPTKRISLPWPAEDRIDVVSAEELSHAEEWLEKRGLEGLLDASTRELKEGWEDRCWGILARQCPKFQVTYETAPVVRRGGFVRLVSIQVVADEAKQVLDSGLAPTSLDVTADFFNMLLQPEKLVAKAAGLAARIVALHLGVPPLVARWIGKAVERLCGSLQEPAGRRATVARTVGRFTVVSDLIGGHVTPTVVNFAVDRLMGGG